MASQRSAGFRLLFVMLLAAVAAACGSDSADQDGSGGQGGTGPERFTPTAFGEWLKFEPEGAVCANGSQYKFFVNFSERSDNVVIFLEGGGACWDYEGCASDGPFNTECIQEPAGAECIRDDYPAVYLHLDELEPFTAVTEALGVVDGDVPVELAYPMLSGNSEINPMGDWNRVFIPYCTGDTYLGSNVETYSDPEGMGTEVEFHHMGHQNMLLVIEELNRMFRSVPKMMVSGCSAGGVGSLNNYPFIRRGMDGVDKAYLIADSGPLIPSTLGNGEPSNSSRVYESIRKPWNVEVMLESLPGSEPIGSDRGEVNRVVAESFPEDRMAISIFERDYIFTVTSYEKTFPIFSEPDTSVNTGAGRTEIYRLASEDLAALRDLVDEIDNLVYYMPYYRNTNASHCLTVSGLEDVGNSELDFITAFLEDPSAATWTGTEIATATSTMTYKDFVEQVLDDSTPLESQYEGTCEGRFQVCALDCEAYDAMMCDAVAE